MMKDTILVIGASGAGKTAALNTVRAVANERNLPQTFAPISDAQTIVSRMLQDDETGGLNHFHPWCEHSHAHQHVYETTHPKFPFTLAGNTVAHAMMSDFFTNLDTLPFDRTIKYAEWSGGENINPSHTRASRTDLSYKTIGRLLHTRTLNPHGLSRVFAVIHLQTPKELREQLNDSRGLPTESDISLGTASWHLDNTAMNIFGHDDGEHIYDLFRAHHISQIIQIHNDGSPGFYDELAYYAHNILDAIHQQSIEGIKRGKESL